MKKVIWSPSIIQRNGEAGSGQRLDCSFWYREIQSDHREEAGRGGRRRLAEAMVNSLGLDWLRSWMPPECMELWVKTFRVKEALWSPGSLSHFSSLRMTGWSSCDCLHFPTAGILIGKEFWAWPRIRLAQQKVAGLFFFGMISEAEACHSSKIVYLLYLMLF